jgi:hypothetical protein
MPEDKVGVDYSFNPPAIEHMVNEGIDFVVRYLPFDGDEGKGIRLDELQKLHANNIAVAFVMQRRGNSREYMGRSNGITDAKIAERALAQLGVPDDRPVYFAVDFDAKPEDQLVIDTYLLGAAEVLGPERVGVYGGYHVAKRCRENRSARWFWQTYAWSGDNDLVGRHIFQHKNGIQWGGGEVDFNRADGSRDFGAWLPGKGPLLDEEGYDVVKVGQRIDRLERIIGGYGIRIGVTESNQEAIAFALMGDGSTAPSPGQTLTFNGETALRVMDAVQASLHLGLAITQERIGEHVANHSAGVHDPGHEHKIEVFLR